MADGLGLVPMQRQGCSRVVVVALVPENAPALGVQGACLDQFVNRAAAFECGVQLEQWIGPQHPLGEALLHIRANAPIADPQEALHVLAVIVNELVAKREDIHAVPPEQAFHASELRLSSKRFL